MLQDYISKVYLSSYYKIVGKNIFNIEIKVKNVYLNVKVDIIYQMVKKNVFLVKFLLVRFAHLPTLAKHVVMVMNLKSQMMLITQAKKNMNVLLNVMLHVRHAS